MPKHLTTSSIIPFFGIFYTCVYALAHIYAGTCVYEGVHTHVCVCVWRPEVSLGWCSLGAVHLVFLRQGFPLALSSPNRLGWLASDLQGSACLSLHLSTGLTSWIFMWVLQTELRSPGLPIKCFIPLSYLLSPCVFYFKTFLLTCSGWPLTHSVSQAGLELSIFLP